MTGKKGKAEREVAKSKWGLWEKKKRGNEGPRKDESGVRADERGIDER